MEGRTVGREFKMLDERGSYDEKKPGGMKKAMASTLMLIIIIVVLLGVIGFVGWKNGWLPSVFGSLGWGNSYQAVFLDNGLLYFGKVSNSWSQYVILTDVYYFVQPQQNQQPQLVKFGTQEIHQPQDEIRINRNHILFIEDLQQKSPVVQAILKYKEQQAK